MYITKDHEELISIIERAAYKAMAECAGDTSIEKAKAHAEYNLGYIDGITDFSENVKAEIRQYVNAEEVKKKEAVKIIKESEAAGQESAAEVSKYDN